jgi:hypothetical protein
MSPVMQPEAKVIAATVAEHESQPDQVASFGTALLGFMITTTLTTSIMVLLSQG